MSALVGSSATPLESVTGLGEGLIEKLSAAGITTVEALADMTPEQLEAIEGIGPKTVEKISLAVNNYFSGLDGGEPAAVSEEAPAEGDLPAEPEPQSGPAEAEAAAVESGATESGEPDGADSEVVERDHPPEPDSEQNKSSYDGHVRNEN
jgi:N utilization substance protein A